MRPLRESSAVVPWSSANRLHAEATVYWDRHASRRYRFSTDDNIYFLVPLHRFTSYGH